MTLQNTAKRYGSITKFFHWTIFILFVVQFTIGFMIMGVATGEAFDSSLLKQIEFHKSLGLLILMIVILRIIWRRISTLPDWAETLTENERNRSHWIERLLYFVMIFKPLSGITLAMTDGQSITFFGLFTIPSLTGQSEVLSIISLIVHILTGLTFFVVWFAHVGMVLKHQFGNRDWLLNRMLPFTNQ
jgi:cytochrome b561